VITLKFKRLKCVSISQSEYDDIKFIDTISSCSKEAVENVKSYLIRDRKVDLKLDDFILCELAYNLYMAVVNNYKYLKVEEN